MLLCGWIFIFGIIFTSVDSYSGIPPSQEQPLKRLLERTINHVKSFLVEFEKKIEDSRHLVNAIHNESLKMNNYSTTIAAYDISENTDWTFVRARPGSEKLAVETLPYGTNLLLNRLNSRIETARNLSKLLNPFKPINTLGVQSEKELKSERESYPIHEPYKTSTKEAESSDISKKYSILNPGLPRLQSDDRNYLPRSYLNKDISLKSKETVIDSVSATKPYRLRVQDVTNLQSTAKSNSQLLVNPEIYSSRSRVVKNIRFQPITSRFHMRTGLKPEAIRRNELFEIFKLFQEPKNTTQDFKTSPKPHFLQNREEITEATPDYPDIFIDPGASTGKENRNLFPNRPTTQFATGIVPDLIKDYQNANFRAQTSEEGDDENPLISKPDLNQDLKYHGLQNKNFSSRTTRYTLRGVYTKKSEYTRKKIKNENLRKIIDASSYSLSNEEEYMKVNLLDHLIHYNKTSATDSE